MDSNIEAFYNKYIEPQKSIIISRLKKEIKEFIKEQRGIGIGIIIIFGLLCSILPISILVGMDYYIQNSFIPLLYAGSFFVGFIALGVYLIKNSSEYEESEYEKESPQWTLEYLQLIDNQAIDIRRYSKAIVLFWTFLIVGGFTNMITFSALPYSLAAIPFGILIGKWILKTFTSPKVILFKTHLLFKGDSVGWDYINSVELLEKMRRKAILDSESPKIKTYLIRVNLKDLYFFDIDFLDRDKALVEIILDFIKFKANI